MEKINLEKIASEASSAQEAVKNNPDSLSAYKKDEEMKEIGLSGELRDVAMEEYENYKSKKAEIAEKIIKADGEETIALLVKELTDLKVAFYGESKESMSDKAYLEEKKKGSNYYEFKSILAGLSEKLPIPTDVKEVKNTKTMTEKEMTAGQKFFTKDEAMGLAVEHSKKGKDGIIWYKDGGELCRVYVHDGGRDVDVYEHVPADRWYDGYTSFFRN